jgi:para-aminobenzoate synthetase / 4-amino-4-deoxychorismate lyase
VFALLDDATAPGSGSRLYTGFAGGHRCDDPATLDGFWMGVDADLQRGHHAVLLADYEWGEKLVLGRSRSAGAALQVLMFRRLDRLSGAEVDVWLAAQDDTAASGVMHLQASVDRAAFVDAVDRIHAAIANGETYQVNHTYRLHGQAYGSPAGLYRALRRRQPVAFGALIPLPDGRCVLSCSPELFLRQDGGVLTARPMKGTAPRIKEPESDSETARLLSLDIKNRAENLMIVDLLRNDLGRIARTGSVKVPSLFAIEPYATLFQMTSTVQAELRPGVGWPELLRATFPCGSITGAPKHHTMELIADLESTPRGLYCGAIGWLEAAPAGRCIGDFCLSVAIRTAVLGAEQGGLRPLTLGIGAGIVHDSVADDEHQECQLKARFLTGLDPGFELFETLLHLPGRGLQHSDLHLARMAGSAAALGFGFDRAAALQVLDEVLAVVAPDQPSRVRLALSHGGRLALSHAPLQPLAHSTVTLLLVEQPLPSANPLAAHKTTLRAHYDAGVLAAERAGAFDSLFFNDDGHLVEGGRSSVFVRLGGRWTTPPLSDGVLPGVMRSLLLKSPRWAASERRLSRGDLQAAQALVVCNALRGVLPARLRHPVTA